MTIELLHKITSKLIAEGHGNDPVTVNYNTFTDNENGAILECYNAGLELIQGADDSGPVGKRYPMLVINGSMAPCFK